MLRALYSFILVCVAHMLLLFVYISILINSKLVECKDCVLLIFVLVPSMVLGMWLAFAKCSSEKLFHFSDGTKSRAEI